jgi:glycine/D-amino acid oxidase-like deaminating enzyme
VIGATFETPTPRFSPGAVGLGSLTWLLERAERLLADRSAVVTGAWWGSRLSGERCGVRPDGVWTLGGLGSKGFLLGPLLARALVDDLMDAPGAASGV